MGLSGHQVTWEANHAKMWGECNMTASPKIGLDNQETGRQGSDWQRGGWKEKNQVREKDEPDYLGPWNQDEVLRFFFFSS